MHILIPVPKIESGCPRSQDRAQLKPAGGNLQISHRWLQIILLADGGVDLHKILLNHHFVWVNRVLSIQSEYVVKFYKEQC